jgi:YVTN family beta-propeller protein
MTTAHARRRATGSTPSLAIESLESRAMLAPVVATVPTGLNPQHMAISPDGRFAYVANNNNFGFAGEDSVTVINLRTNQAVATIRDASFSEPYTITINPRGTTAYVTNSGSSTVSVIDLKTRAVVGVINGFDGPSGMVLQGNYGYVNNYGASEVWNPTTRTNDPLPNAVGSGSGNTVSVVDLRTRQITSTFTVGAAPAAVATDGTFVYTANYVDGNPDTGTLSKYSIASRSVVATIGPAAGAFTATVGGNPRAFSNPNDYQVLYATAGTASGGLYNVAGHGETAADYAGFVAGQIALIPRDVGDSATVNDEYLQAAVDQAVYQGAIAVVFYNATFSGATRTPVNGLTGTSPAGVFPTSVLFPGYQYQQPNVTTVGAPVAPVPVIFVTNKSVIEGFVGGPSTGSGGSALPGVSVSLTTATGFSGPFSMAVRGHTAYVTNFGSNNFAPFGRSLVEVDLRGGGRIVSVIPVGIQPSGVAISPNGRYAYVTNYNTLYTSVRLNTTGPANRIGQPTSYGGLTAGRGTVSVVDLRTKRVVRTIGVDQSPSNIVLGPNGRRAVVANYTSNTVSVITLG